MVKEILQIHTPFIMASYSLHEMYLIFIFPHVCTCTVNLQFRKLILVELPHLEVVDKSVCPKTIDITTPFG